MEPTDLETALEGVDRLEEAWRLFVAFSAECRVKRIGYHHLPPAGAPDAHLLRIENEGFGEALLSQYVTARAHGFAALANIAQRSIGPVYLEDLLLSPELSDREREHIVGYRAAGVVNGLALQAFGPNGRNGIFAIELVADTPRLPPDLLARLRWACQAMHLRYCTLLLPTLGALPSLSSREAEVLTWVVRGKTNASIGDILGISAHTVDAHLRRIYIKLGVFDRISAALRALGFGLINVEP